MAHGTLWKHSQPGEGKGLGRRLQVGRMNTLSEAGHITTVCYFRSSSVGIFSIPPLLAIVPAERAGTGWIRPPGGSGPGSGLANRLTRAAGEMRFCLPEPWPA